MYEKLYSEWCGTKHEVTHDGDGVWLEQYNLDAAMSGRGDLLTSKEARQLGVWLIEASEELADD